MEDVVHAMIMAFSVLVFVIGLSVVMYMFQQVTETSENILYYSDETNYYDNIKIEEGHTTRTVDTDTVIFTLYRYYKENFCVKIYDAPAAGGELLQVFDVNLEGKVRQASAISDANVTAEQKALKKIYNDKTSPLYLFEAPWIGSTDEDIKTRIDYYINGSAGYINNTYVNYKKANNKFYEIRLYNQTASEANKVYFKEEFIRYTYTGDTMVNDEGEILVEGAAPKDKIVITYTATKDI